MRKAKLLLLFVCRMLGLFRLANWITRDQLKILCYHGFALDDEAKFRPKLFIGPETFEARLATIRRYGLQTLTLDDAVHRLYTGSLPDRAMVITVDDGFHSVHRIAAPALQKHGLAATVYVTTYYVEHANPVFMLVIQYMFWKTRRQTLELKDVPWSADTVINLTNPVFKDQAIWECVRYGVAKCTEAQRCAISRQLGDLLEVPYEDIERSRILHLMTPVELRGLCGANIDVQLHTHRHVFPGDDPVGAEKEIADNRAALRRLLGGGKFDHFCYPSGRWEKRQWASLEAMGVKSSVTCLPGLNSRATPRQALRRFLDGENIHSLEFEAELSGFSDLIRPRREDKILRAPDFGAN